MAYSIKACALSPSLPNEVVKFSLRRAFGSFHYLQGLIEQESPGGPALLFPDEPGEKGAEIETILIKDRPPFAVPLIRIITILINHLCHWTRK